MTRSADPKPYDVAVDSVINAPGGGVMTTPRELMRSTVIPGGHRDVAVIAPTGRPHRAMREDGSLHSQVYAGLKGE